MYPLENEDLGKLVVRLMVSVLLLFHGVHKIMHFSGTVGWLSAQLASHGLPEFIAYGVYIGEVLGPLMVLAGIFTRVGGLFIVVNMLFAIGLVHMDKLLALTDTGAWAIQLDLFFLLSGLAVMFLGSGRYAILDD